MRAGLGAMAGTALAACGSEPSRIIVTPPQDALLPEVALTTIPLAHSNTMADAPLLIALERSLFDAETLAPEIQLGAEDQELIDLLTTGSVEIALGALGPAFFNAVQARHDLKIIGPLSRAMAPLPMPLMVSRDRYESGEIAAIADLAGQTIGTAHGGFSEYLLGKALESGGLTPSDIRIELTSDHRLKTRLERGLIGEPEAAEAIAADQAVLLSDDYLPSYTASYILTTGGFLGASTETVSALLGVLYAGCAHMLGDAFFDDLNLKIYRLYHGTEESVLAQMRPYTCGVDGSVDVPEIESLQHFYQDNAMLNLTTALDVSVLVDDALAREAAAAIFES